MSPPKQRYIGRREASLVFTKQFYLIVLLNLGVLLFNTGKVYQSSEFFNVARTDVSFSPSSNTTVEDLMYKYKSDKSRDDHGYTKLYNMILSPIRHSVRNITEVGIAAGQSLQAWYRYFPNAEIHAFDVHWMDDRVKENLGHLKPRVHSHIVNILDDRGGMNELGFLNESMDLIIEDGPHTVGSQEDFLIKLFPLLKPGGFYIIEDIGYAQQGLHYFHENPSKLKNETREIFESHDAIWVDTALGHRAWKEWIQKVGGMWAKNRTHHNSFCVVIQKREVSLRQPMQMHYKGGAMDPGSIVMEEGGS
ncbi:hypothetical protein ACHAXR_002376 [Thalassiosira sp. AJA248-18]